MAALMGLVRHAVVAATAHQNLARLIDTEVCGPLEQRIPPLEVNFKQLMQDSIKNNSDYRASIAKLDKAKALFFKVCRDLKETPEISNKPELVKKRTKLQTEIVRCTRDYRAQVAETNGVQTKFLLENRRVMEEFQKLDRTTVELLPRFISRFFEIQEQIPPKMVTEFSSLRTLSTLQTYSEDLDFFIKKNKSNTPVPRPFEFEAFKEVSADPSPKKHKKTWLQKFHKHKSEDVVAKLHVFGISLPVLLARDQRTIDSTLKVPVILILMRDSIINLAATSTEGIFRISGNQNELNDYHAAFDNGEFVISASTNVHTMCSLFKLFFRELPDAIVNRDIYNTCVNTDVINAITADTVDELVLCHFEDTTKEVLLFLLRFMAYLAQHYKHTKMDQDNLAMVLAPCLIRCQVDNPLEMLQTLEKQKSFIRALMAATPPDTSPLSVPAFTTRVNHRGDRVPYDGRGFEVLSNEEMEMLRSARSGSKPLSSETAAAQGRPRQPSEPGITAPFAQSPLQRLSVDSVRLERAVLHEDDALTVLSGGSVAAAMTTVSDSPSSRKKLGISLLAFVKPKRDESQAQLQRSPVSPGQGQIGSPRSLQRSPSSSCMVAEGTTSLPQSPTAAVAEATLTGGRRHRSSSVSLQGTPHSRHKSGAVQSEAASALRTSSPQSCAVDELALTAPTPDPTPPSSARSCGSSTEGSESAAGDSSPCMLKTSDKEKEKEKERRASGGHLRRDMKQAQAALQGVRAGLSALRQELQAQASVLQVLRAAAYIITYRKLVTKCVSHQIDTDYHTFLEHHKPLKLVTPSHLADVPDGFDVAQLYENLNEVRHENPSFCVRPAFACVNTHITPNTLNIRISKTTCIT
eukprot:TRINITY_DN5006_c0_g1_i3.p1 TRINITY_DN5006_c0_g1~~TRINITY_DN5006_c0_g1_i3.p1  ORF type:complete len:942 (+),score=223.68 TRINITY_DN5006_c0_g1_i3:245-2827(+)